MQGLMERLRSDQQQMASKMDTHGPFERPVRTADGESCEHLNVPQHQLVEQDLQRLRKLQYDGHHVSDEAHGGIPTRHANPQSHGCVTRDDLAMLHSAGFNVSEAAYNALHVAPALPVLEFERTDRNTVSSIVLQFISFAPFNAFNMPQAIESVFFRFQLFDFAATQSDTFRLEASRPGNVRDSIVTIYSLCSNRSLPRPCLDHRCHAALMYTFNQPVDACRAVSTLSSFVPLPLAPDSSSLRSMDSWTHVV
jgi:hypothetical protein